MKLLATVEMRPRTTGEILDDAWHLALADAPLLLLLSGLFLVPAFSVVLWLVTRTPADGLLWPALAASLLILTGLGSGACQELLRRRAVGEEVAVASCLRQALGDGLGHVSARALVLAGTLQGPVWAAYALSRPASETTPPLVVVLSLVGLCVLCLLCLGIWAFAAPVHVLLADSKERSTGLLAELASEARFAAWKAAAVIGSRVPLLLLAVLNLHLLVVISLWAADNLGGLDMARLQAEMALMENPPYLLALLFLCWLLLTPFFEAGNFLLHLDVRTRQEGLDLFYRVQRAFPLRERPVAAGLGRGKVLGASLLLGLAGLFGTATPVHADEHPRPSREEIKKLLSEQGGGQAPAPQRTQKKPKPHQEHKKEEPAKDHEEQRPGVRPRRPVGGVGGGGGFGHAGWFLLGGLALGLLAVAGYQLWTNRSPRTARPTTTGTTPRGPEIVLPQPHEEGSSELWRRAEGLAREGRFLDAVRAVYLAVLSLLYRQGLIRFEPMRTNGEYVQQLRRAADAPAELADCFQRLTLAFEMRWYGERACSADEYAHCRELAKRIYQPDG